MPSALTHTYTTTLEPGVSVSKVTENYLDYTSSIMDTFTNCVVCVRYVHMAKTCSL